MQWNKEKPPITEAEWEQWEASPVTQAVRQYCRDFAEQVREGWADMLDAETSFDIETFRIDRRARRDIALSFAELSREVLEEFYTEEEDEDEQSEQ